MEMETRPCVDQGTQLAKSLARAAILVVMCGAVTLPTIGAQSVTARSPAVAQQNSPPDPQTGTVSGTVTDEKGDAVAAATIVLEPPSQTGDRRTVTSN